MGILATQESLDGVVQPPDRQAELFGHLRRRLVDGELGLEHRVHVSGRAPRGVGQGHGGPADDVHLALEALLVETVTDGDQGPDDLVAVHVNSAAAPRPR